MSFRSYLHSRGYSSRESIVIIRKMSEKGILSDVKSAFSVIVSLEKAFPELTSDLMKEYDLVLRKIIELVMFGRRFMSKGESLEYYIDKVNELRKVAEKRLIELKNLEIERIFEREEREEEMICSCGIDSPTPNNLQSAQAGGLLKDQEGHRHETEVSRDTSVPVARGIEELSSKIDPVGEELKALLESAGGSLDSNTLWNLVDEAKILQDKLIEREKEGDYETILKVRRILADRSKGLKRRLDEALSIISERSFDEEISPRLYKLWKIRVIRIVREKGYVRISDLDFVPDELLNQFLERLVRDTGYRIIEDRLISTDGA